MLGEMDASAEILHSYLVKVKKVISGLGDMGFLWFSLLLLSLIFTFYAFSSSTPLKNNADTSANTHFQWPQTDNESSCDLFDGRWIPDEDGPLYSNFSCTTIPSNRNCFLHGRRNREYLYWRWKPERCELPRFDSKAFLSIVKGKTMAFIGDSLSRNHLDSLLCLLSMEKTPRNVYNDTEDKMLIWHYSHYNFTLMVIRSEYIINTSEPVSNFFTGYYHLHLDKPDHKWTQKLSIIDIAIFSGSQWFFRPIYLYLGGNLIGCIDCKQSNVTDLGAKFAIGRAFQTAFEYVNEMRKDVVVFLRTYSPSHFEHGAWHNGGFCNKTRLYTREEINFMEADDWEYRNIQVQEIERAKRYGEKRGNKFEIIDVTRAMMMRSDAHPGLSWGVHWVRGRSDCLHWCLPGPVDIWSEFLLQMLRKIE